MEIKPSSVDFFSSKIIDTCVHNIERYVVYIELSLCMTQGRVIVSLGMVLMLHDVSFHLAISNGISQIIAKSMGQKLGVASLNNIGGMPPFCDDLTSCNN